MTIGIAQQRVAYQVTLRLRHNFLLAGENAMLARMPFENPSIFSHLNKVSINTSIISAINKTVKS